MITSTKNLEKYCKDYQNIQNYEDAVKSPLKYDLHHRREISENKSRKDLIAENLYYNRPATELIFLERGEHQRLHNAGKPKSVEWKQKLSDALKGRLVSEDTRKKMSEAKKGKHPSAESRKKMSEALKGHLVSEDTRNKISDAKKGKHRHIENGHYVYTD